MEYWHYWVMFSLLLFILEIFTPGGFVLASLGIGALSGAGFAFMGFGMNIQLLCFSVSSLIVFFAVRPVYMAYINKYDENLPTGVAAMIGQRVKVIEAIGNPDASDPGRIKFSGETWRAFSEDEVPYDVGSVVEIVKVDGATVWVIKNDK